MSSLPALPVLPLRTKVEVPRCKARCELCHLSSTKRHVPQQRYGCTQQGGCWVMRLCWAMLQGPPNPWSSPSLAQGPQLHRGHLGRTCQQTASLLNGNNPAGWAPTSE